MRCFIEQGYSTSGATEPQNLMKGRNQSMYRTEIPSHQVALMMHWFRSEDSWFLSPTSFTFKIPWNQMLVGLSLMRHTLWRDWFWSGGQGHIAWSQTCSSLIWAGGLFSEKKTIQSLESTTWVDHLHFLCALLSLENGFYRFLI